MNRDDAIRKIKACLALSKSAQPADDDDEPLTAVYRRDLCELLSQLGENAEEKLDFLIQLGAEAQTENLQ